MIIVLIKHGLYGSPGFCPSWGSAPWTATVSATLTRAYSAPRSMLYTSGSAVACKSASCPGLLEIILMCLASPSRVYLGSAVPCNSCLAMCRFIVLVTLHHYLISATLPIDWFIISSGLQKGQGSDNCGFFGTWHTYTLQRLPAQTLTHQSAGQDRSHGIYYIFPTGKPCVIMFN